MGISPQEKLILTGYNRPGTELLVQLWEIPSGKKIFEKREPIGLDAIRFESYRRSFHYQAGKDSPSNTWTEMGTSVLQRQRTMARLPDALAFSPDGRWTVCVDHHQAVTIRDVVSRKPQHFLKDHLHPVQIAAFSPDSQMVVTGDATGQLIFWKTTTGENLKTVSFSGSLFSAPFLAIETASPDATPLSKTSAVSQDKGLTSITFSPDQKIVAAGTANGYTQTFSVEQGTALTPVFHQSSVMDIVFAGNSSAMFVLTRPGNVVRWWRAPPPPDLLAQQQGSVRFAMLDATGKRAVTGGVDRQLRVWDVDRRLLTHTLDNGTEAIVTGSLSPDGRRAVTAAYGSGITFWDLAGMKSLGKRYGHQKRVWAFDMARNGETLASASDDQTVRLWNFPSQKVKRIIELDAAVRFVRFSPEGKRLVTATLAPQGWQHPARLQLWDVETGKPLMEFHGHRTAVNSAVFSPDGQELISVDAEGQLCRWNAFTGKLLQKQRHATGLSHAGFIEPRGLIVTRQYPNRCLIQRLEGLTLVSAFDVPTKSMTDLNIAAQGNRLIAGTEEGGIYVWDLETR